MRCSRMLSELVRRHRQRCLWLYRVAPQRSRRVLVEHQGARRVRARQAAEVARPMASPLHRRSLPRVALQRRTRESGLPHASDCRRQAWCLEIRRPVVHQGRAGREHWLSLRTIRTFERDPNGTVSARAGPRVVQTLCTQTVSHHGGPRVTRDTISQTVLTGPSQGSVPARTQRDSCSQGNRRDRRDRRIAAMR